MNFVSLRNVFNRIKTFTLDWVFVGTLFVLALIIVCCRAYLAEGGKFWDQNILAETLGFLFEVLIFTFLVKLFSRIFKKEVKSIVKESTNSMSKALIEIDINKIIFSLYMMVSESGVSRKLCKRPWLMFQQMEPFSLSWKKTESWAMISDQFRVLTVHRFEASVTAR